MNVFRRLKQALDAHEEQAKRQDTILSQLEQRFTEAGSSLNDVMGAVAEDMKGTDDGD